MITNKSTNEQENPYTLTHEEKARIRARLVEHMEKHPLTSPYLTPSPFSMFVSHKAMSFVVVTLFLFIFTGTGALFAAQNSLPGEPLYLIKRNVSEEIYSLLLTSSETKARYEASRIDKRLAEARKLSEQGKLTLETKETLEVSISDHAQKTSELIDAMASKNTDIFALSEDVALARFEGVVEAKKTILADLPASDAPVAVVDSSASEDLRIGGNSGDVDLSDGGIALKDNSSSPVLAPYVRPLSKDELALLEKAALVEVESTRALLKEAAEADTLNLRTKQVQAALESIETISGEIEVLKLQADTDSSIREKTRLFKELISTSEKIKTYIAEILAIPTEISGATSTPSVEEEAAGALLAPQQ